MADSNTITPIISIEAIGPTSYEGSSADSTPLGFTVELKTDNGELIFVSEDLIIKVDITGEAEIIAKGAAAYNVGGVSFVNNQGVATVIIPAGSASANISGYYQGDDDVDADNDITLSILNVESGDASIDPENSSATTTILNDDFPSLTLAAPAENVNEGNDGETGQMTFTATLSETYNKDVTANVSVAGATGPATITIPAGETSANIIVEFDGDNIDEANEPVTVTLSGLANAAPGTVEATALILNDDDPTLSIAAPADIEEGDQGTNTMEFTVTLDKVSDVTVSADVAINGAATGPSSITIPPGLTSTLIFIEFTGDELDEADEEITVTLSNLDGATTGTNEGTVEASALILNDDDPIITISAPENVIEGDENEGGTLEFTVELDAASNEEVTAKVAITGDAKTELATVTIPAGETSATITVSYEGDNIGEADEPITVTLSEVANAVIDSADPTVVSLNATAKILDDDAIDLSNDPIESYSSQDEGTAEISEDGTQITITGNAWKSLLRDIEITANTVLTFEVNASDVGEILAIGFENSEELNSTEVFQLAGTEILVGADTNYSYDDVAGGTQSISIPVGTLIPTGSYDRLVFIGDDDADSSTEATFSNILISENATPIINEAPEIVVDSTIKTGTITELADQDPAENNSELEATGIITFTDNDDNLSQDHTVKVEADGADYLGKIAIDYDPSDFGIVDWNFSVQDSDLNSLAQGEMLTQTYTVTITDPKGASTTETISIDLNGTVDLPTLSVIAPENAQEGDDGETGTLIFTANLDEAAEADVTADVIIAGGATGPATITIPAGETSADITLSYEGDDVEEGNEPIAVTLSNAVGVNAGQLSVIALILDDDAPVVEPVLSITAPADAAEGDDGETGTMLFTVTLDKTSDVAVTADVTIAGNATGPATISIPAGETSADISLSFEGDDVDEADEPITVTLSNPVGATEGTLEATANILDDDEPVIEQLPPVAGDDVVDEVLASDETVGASVDFLLANDSDPEGDDIEITSATSALGAKILLEDLDGDGVNDWIGYDPLLSADIQALAEGEQITDIVTYTISDGNGGTDTAEITLTVEGRAVNQAPIANDDVVEVVLEADEIVGDKVDFLLANDSDPEGEQIAVTSVDATSALGAAISLFDTDNDGIIDYIEYDPTGVALAELPKGELYKDSVTYYISDTSGATDSATIDLTIIGTYEADMF